MSSILTAPPCEIKKSQEHFVNDIYKMFLIFLIPIQDRISQSLLIIFAPVLPLSQDIFSYCLCIGISAHFTQYKNIFGFHAAMTQDCILQYCNTIAVGNTDQIGKHRIPPSRCHGGRINICGFSFQPFLKLSPQKIV